MIMFRLLLLTTLWLCVAASADQTSFLSLIKLNDYTGLQEYIDQGHDLEITNADGETPLYYAVRLNRSQSLAILMEAGANPNPFNLHGYTPLSIAIHGKHLDIVRAGPAKKPINGLLPITALILKKFVVRWIATVLGLVRHVAIKLDTQLSIAFARMHKQSSVINSTTSALTTL